MREKIPLLTVTLSGADLELMRDSLLLALKRTPMHMKGKKRWLAINTAYDNLVDACTKAEAEALDA